MKYAIDRFENNYAITELEDNGFANIPKAALPPNAKEGDVISIEIDVAATNKRKEHMIYPCFALRERGDNRQNRH